MKLATSKLFCKIKFNEITKYHCDCHSLWDHSFSASKVFQKIHIFYPLIRTRTCAYHEVRNISFRKILRPF